jgi:hypothetical protein
VTIANGNPAGPVSTERLLRSIGAAEIPKDAFVCEVGGTAWRMVGSVAEFRDAFARDPKRGLEEPTTTVQPIEELTGFSSVPPPLPWSLDESEHTVVSPPPFSPSESPPEYAEQDDDEGPTIQIPRTRE